MPGDRRSSADFVSEGWKGAENYRSLFFQVLKHADQGLPRREFLQKISTLLLEFSGCELLETWISDEGKHYRCAVTPAGKDSFSYRLMPFKLGVVSGQDPPDLERLCRAVIRRQPDDSSSLLTGGGSFWTGDVSAMPAVSLGKGAMEPLQIEGGFRSLALIPIMVGEKCVGLLIMQSRKKDFFSEEQVAFYEDIVQILGIALVHRRAQIELRERVKELTCLYGIAQEVARSESSLEEIIGNIVKLLPPGWLYPEIASARIVLDGEAFTTPGFSESSFSQRSDIFAGNKRVGFVEVTYSERRSELDEGPFLAEERSMIDNIAREVGLFYKRRKTEEEAALLHEQLRHADRLATIGQLAAGVAHELNEPLGNILGFAQLASRTQDLPGQTEKDLGKIVSASLHAKEIIKKLMVFARELPPKMVSIDLNKVAEEALYFFDARCAKAGIELVRRFDPDLPEITGDPGQLNQVIVNLVVNAFQAMPDGGTLVVETLAHEGQIILIVADSGQGMSEEVKNQIFIPFFTTKDVNEGTGLGLPVVHGIVTSHRGVITVESEVGRGTRFEIMLPISSPDDSEENRRDG